MLVLSYPFQKASIELTYSIPKLMPIFVYLHKFSSALEMLHLQNIDVEQPGRVQFCKKSKLIEQSIQVNGPWKSADNNTVNIWLEI